MPKDHKRRKRCAEDGYVDTEEIYMRNHLIPFDKTTVLPTYIVWTRNLSRIIGIFEDTVLECEQKIDPGIFDQRAKFLYILDEVNVNDIDETKPEDILESGNRYIQMHRQTSVIQPLGQAGKFKFYGYNAFKSKMELKSIWQPGQQSLEWTDLFWDVSNFHGKSLERAFIVVQNCKDCLIRFSS